MFRGLFYNLNFHTCLEFYLTSSYDCLAFFEAFEDFKLIIDSAAQFHRFE